MLIPNMIFLVVSLRRVAPNTSEQRSRSGLCERVIRREATETEGLVYVYIQGRQVPTFLITHQILWDISHNIQGNGQTRLNRSVK